ncbi:MAG TPA: endolytic transglycosylase MltG [Acidimicrobiia bacterium]|nr:endolytic transglycosylase MltG [Acidimicrobiia bacterium]
MPSEAQWRSARSRRSRERNRTYRRNVMTLIVVGVMLTPLALASFWVLSNVASSTSGNADVVVEIQQGWTPAQVGDTLEQKGVIASSAAFQEVAASAQFTTWSAGNYDFVENSGPREALDTLRGGPRRSIPDIELLLPPALSLQQIADRVGKIEGKSAQRFMEAAQSNTIRSRYQPTDSLSLEGFTWPDTYFIGANQTEAEILQKIVSQFDAKADEIGLGASGAANGGLTPYQALISASLIEAEAGSKDDAPLISAVIVNRLKDDMPLQIDATLCYAKGGCPPVPTDDDRKIDSPYNTYKNKGLPPGPIKTVSEVALRAALNPAFVAYKYYVSDANGKTYYAETLSEHDRNVAKARDAG